MWLGVKNICFGLVVLKSLFLVPQVIILPPQKLTYMSTIIINPYQYVENYITIFECIESVDDIDNWSDSFNYSLVNGQVYSKISLNSELFMKRNDLWYIHVRCVTIPDMVVLSKNQYLPSVPKVLQRPFRKVEEAVKEYLEMQSYNIANEDLWIEVNRSVVNAQNKRLSDFAQSARIRKRRRVVLAAKAVEETTGIFFPQELANITYKFL